MIKNIVFDLGGVIIDYTPEKIVSGRFDEETCCYIIDNIFHSPEWNEIDRGVTTPDEAFGYLKERLGEENYCRIIDIVDNLGDYMPPFEDTYFLIERLKKAGWPIYLLSNIPPYFYRCRENIPALRFFDGTVISSDIKMCKPEIGIFEHLCTEFGLSPSECVFIDDMQKNVDGAVKAGFSGICFANHDIPALEASLRELGISF